MSPRRAIALDAACPPALYAMSEEGHSCAICLDAFVKERDIVRRLPCAHVFHSKCKCLFLECATLIPHAFRLT